MFGRPLDSANAWTDAILPASAVKHSVASVIACDIVDQIPMSEIGIAVSKGVRPAVV